MLLCDRVFLAEQSKDGNAGLARTISIIGTIVANNLYERSNRRIELTGGKMLNCRVVQLANLAVGELPRISREGVESGDNPDGINHVSIFWFMQIYDRCGCLSGISEDKTPGQKNTCIDISGFKGEDFFKQSSCSFRVPGGEECFGLFNVFPVLAGNGVFEPALDLILRECANKLVHDDSIHKQLHVRYTLDLVLACDVCVLFCIYFG